MPFADFPRELILEIQSHLPIVDKVCLSLTCRGLKATIDQTLKLKANHGLYFRPRRIKLPKWENSDEPFARIQLIDRLFRDGLYQTEDKELCVNCLNVKYIEDFAGARGFKLDNRHICNTCQYSLLLKHLSPGHRLACLNTGDVSICIVCNAAFETAVTRAHDFNRFGDTLRICSVCDYMRTSSHTT